eukprot:TRINITY_DN61355_c0_g1_i1.p2 TRINITY_DN61355_c0_g1~~TRINITY_DN61355_c0_g1_i1.p2  ORF type:complete len:203 (+),score=88.24 TRINITY_DN61355_c0_g1_i1:94-702(+)
MGKKRNTKFAQVKKILNKDKAEKALKTQEEESRKRKRFFDPAACEFSAEKVRRVEQVHSNMYLSHNQALGPPYRVLMDTNFINFSLQNKMDIVQGMMDCLYAKVTPYICSCVMAELEKLGDKFKVALRLSKDPRFKRLECDNTYADDCIVDTVTQHPIWIVGTMDKDLKRRIRKIPGVPIMYISKHRYTIERLPDAYGAPRE